jgi:hypothetical protein
MKELTVTVTIADETRTIGTSELTVPLAVGYDRDGEDWLKDKYRAVANFVVDDAWHHIRWSP